MALFRVSSWFVCHDVKHSGLAECVVDRDSAPTEAEAERLLWPVADAQLERIFGAAGQRCELTGITVSQQPVLGITGSTGAVGGLVARQVSTLAPILLVRNVSRAPDLGLTVRHCDYGRDESASAALHGVEVLFMVSAHESPDRRDEHRAFVRAAADAGVRHIVYTSFVGAAPDATFTLARDHHDTESAIRDSGMAFTFLRDNFYLDVLPQFADASGVLRGPADDGRVAAVARVDVADIAAAVLRDPDRHAGTTYTLTGPEALTLTEVAARAGSVLGRPMNFENQTEDEAYATRSASGDVPQWQLDAWVSTYRAIADGSCAEVTDDIRKLRGFPGRTLEDALRVNWYPWLG